MISHGNIESTKNIYQVDAFDIDRQGGLVGNPSLSFLEVTQILTSG
jgi:hypothetical protein